MWWWWWGGGNHSVACACSVIPQAMLFDMLMVVVNKELPGPASRINGEGRARGEEASLAPP